ncbi:hypothetical protein V8C35DRAFT_20918 [Trichoderma chlorosporum]
MRLRLIRSGFAAFCIVNWLKIGMGQWEKSERGRLLELGEKDRLKGPLAPPPPCSSYQQKQRRDARTRQPYMARLATANRRMACVLTTGFASPDALGVCINRHGCFSGDGHEFVFSVCAGRLQVRRAVLQLQRIRQASLLVHRGGREPNRSSPRYPRYHHSLGLTQHALDVPCSAAWGSNHALPCCGRYTCYTWMDYLECSKRHATRFILEG